MANDMFPQIWITEGLKMYEISNKIIDYVIPLTTVYEGISTAWETLGPLLETRKHKAPLTLFLCYLYLYTLSPISNIYKYSQGYH